MREKKRRVSGLGAVLVVAVAAVATLGVGFAGSTDELVFDDVREQTVEFIGYDDSIELTPEQQAVKSEALEALPAPCCSDNSAETCCCPCNMSRSAWGLAKHLIADRGQNAEQVRAKVSEWFEFINPDGFSGDVCYTGGCMRPFSDNGCGGMTKERIVF